MKNIWLIVFMWLLPVMCFVLSVVGFVSYFTEGGNNNLSAGIFFAIVTPLIVWANVSTYKSGYFD